MTFFDVVILSAIEGLAEFLPISSTGHLILASKALNLAQDDFLTSFQISIQLGAILAVVFLFWKQFLEFNLLLKLAVAFVPTGFCGLFLYKFIRSLFDARVVVYSLIIGGVLFIALEWHLGRDKAAKKVERIEDVGFLRAFFIGCFQSLAVIPGTSRSGASIFGGLILGLNRRVATEFSFLLAVPTMVAAVGYDTYKNLDTFSAANAQFIALGVVLSFLFALVAIKALLRFVSRYSYSVFGVYRIVIGIVFLAFVL